MGRNIISYHKYFRPLNNLHSNFQNPFHEFQSEISRGKNDMLFTQCSNRNMYKASFLNQKLFKSMNFNEGETWFRGNQGVQTL